MNARVTARNTSVVALAAALIGAVAVVFASTASSAPAAPAASKVLLKSSLDFDAKAGTITLPLFKGRSASGGTVWYVVTDSSDRPTPVAVESTSRRGSKTRSGRRPSREAV